MYRFWTTYLLTTIIVLAACTTPPTPTTTPTPAPTPHASATELPAHIPGTWVSPSDATFALDIDADGTVAMRTGNETIELTLVSNGEDVFALDDGFSEPYFATFKSNRMYVYRTPDTSQQPAFILAKQAANEQIMPPEGEPAPLSNDLVGQWAMPGALDRWHLVIEADGHATFGGEANTFRGVFSANSDGILFFDDGASPPVRVERKGALLLFASPTNDENALGFVLQKLDTTGAPLPIDHTSVVSRPLFEPELVETIVITHAWNGGAPQAPIMGVFTLTITNDQAIGSATYTAGTGTDAMTQTVPITIPTAALTPLLDAAATAPLLDEPYRAVLLATDNYPSYGVEINTSNQRITYRALSQLPIPLPWHVVISGDPTIYVSYTPTIGHALYTLDPYVRRDVQQAMVPWYRPWLVEEEP